MKNNVTLEQVRELAVKVQSLMFDRFQSGVDDTSVLSDGWSEINAARQPLLWFSQAYAVNEFESIFRKWDNGIESMRGKSLYSRCLELTGETKC